MSSEIDTIDSDAPKTGRRGPISRLARGVALTVLGPLNIVLGILGLTRGVLGFGLGTAVSGARLVGRRCHKAEDGGQELALVQEVAASSGRRRPLLLIGASLAVLALGGVTFSIVRRSMQPEPSPLPPSVNVTPQP